MNHYGLIGHPLGHSFSKAYFTAKFEREGLDCEYRNFDIPSLGEHSSSGTSLRALAKQSMLSGFNVTIPYKEAIIPYLDKLDSAAKEIGAVNTVKVQPDGRLIGYNTDVIGFEFLWGKRASDNRHCEGGTTEAIHIAHTIMALILGTGGASKAVQYVLKKNHIPYHLVSRDAMKGFYTYDQLTLEIIKEHLLIINTSPVGMAPNIEAAPAIPYDAITYQHTLIDLIYNPEETLFLRHGREHGATTANGLPMLYAQAEAAWKIWNDSL